MKKHVHLPYSNYAARKAMHSFFFNLMGFVQVTLFDLFKKKILSRTLFDGETIAHYENAELAI